MEIQKKSLHRRLTASLKKNEQLVPPPKAPSPRPLVPIAKAIQPLQPPRVPSPTKLGVPSSTYCELLGVALSWVYHLHSALPLNAEQTWVRSKQVCLRLLPSLAEVLPEVASMGPEGQLSYLEFVHWAVSNLDGGKQQRTLLAPSLRRIGEEVYCPAKPTGNDVTGKSEGSHLEHTSSRQAKSCFMNSPELRVRVLSSLVALSTITRVDCLAHVMDVLKAELKEDMAKQVFLDYNGVNVLLIFLKPQSRVLWGHVGDIHLQLSVESAMLPHFLAACSCKVWFDAVTFLLKELKAPAAVLEKLSIVLQKLSKMKNTKQLFEAFHFTSLVPEALRTYAHSDGFLCLNLRSVLVNISENH